MILHFLALCVIIYPKEEWVQRICKTPPFWFISILFSRGFICINILNKIEAKIETSCFELKNQNIVLYKYQMKHFHFFWFFSFLGSEIIWWIQQKSVIIFWLTRIFIFYWGKKFCPKKFPKPYFTPTLHRYNGNRELALLFLERWILGTDSKALSTLQS